MIPGFLVAAPKSGSGKTVLTLGLMRAFARAGLRVSGIKNGPDYIDPAFHAAATGRASLNLDTWAMPAGLVAALAHTATMDADLVIGEGSMGLFDGVAAPPGRTGASADLAARLVCPSCSSSTCQANPRRRPPSPRVRSLARRRSGRWRDPEPCRQRAASQVGRRRDHGEWPPRLGRVAALRDFGLARTPSRAGAGRRDAAPRCPARRHRRFRRRACRCRRHPRHGDTPRIGSDVVRRRGPAAGPAYRRRRDAAFSFFYPHLAQGWLAAGASLHPFSPLADEAPPEGCDVCWLPGGYPELHADALARATRFATGLRRFAETRPVHGECGGYMVLGQSLTDAKGIMHPMAGLLGAAFSFAKRKMTLGYRDVTLAADCLLGPSGTRLRGHEFHYATMREAEVPDAPLVTARDAHGGAPVPAGSRRGMVTGRFLPPRRGGRMSTAMVIVVPSGA